ncbi:unnamed protein product [Macrosiphum euphorbiae]|uniref:Uncharacterized protein n=1 Tax=Macrosiphum euphorbiae TaxID=13131 RepID=A0AAV0VKI0_9HEMI|nr:unnamed protein product [Macrosiphum euphorbiae]
MTTKSHTVIDPVGSREPGPKSRSEGRQRQNSKEQVKDCNTRQSSGRTHKGLSTVTSKKKKKKKKKNPRSIHPQVEGNVENTKGSSQRPKSDETPGSNKSGREVQHSHHPPKRQEKVNKVSAVQRERGNQHLTGQHGLYQQNGKTKKSSSGNTRYRTTPGFSKTQQRVFPIPTHHERRENPSRTVDAKNQGRSNNIKVNGQRTSPKSGRRSIQGGGDAKPTAFQTRQEHRAHKGKRYLPHAREKRLQGYPNRCNCRFNTMINRGVGRHHVLPTLESTRPVKLTITSHRLTQSRAQVYRH